MRNLNKTIHFIAELGPVSNKYFGIVLESSKTRTDGKFIGILIYFWSKCLLIGVCIHEEFKD